MYVVCPPPGLGHGKILGKITVASIIIVRSTILNTLHYARQGAESGCFSKVGHTDDFLTISFLRTQIPAGSDFRDAAQERAL